MEGIFGEVEEVLVVKVCGTLLPLLRKGVCGPVQESLLSTPGLVIDVRHRR